MFLKRDFLRNFTEKHFYQSLCFNKSVDCGPTILSKGYFAKLFRTDIILKVFFLSHFRLGACTIRDWGRGCCHKFKISVTVFSIIMQIGLHRSNSSLHDHFYFNHVRIIKFNTLPLCSFPLRIPQTAGECKIPHPKLSGSSPSSRVRFKFESEMVLDKRWPFLTPAIWSLDRCVFYNLETNFL